MIGILDSAFMGGNLEIYGRTEVEISSGVDSLINSSLIDRLTNIIDDIERLGVFT